MKFFTSKIIEKSFRDTGIYPFQKEKIISRIKEKSGNLKGNQDNELESTRYILLNDLRSLIGSIDKNKKKENDPKFKQD